MIVRIYTSPESGAEMVSYRSRKVIESRGLDGDRYALGREFYSGVAEWDAHVTLMQIEPLDSLATEHGCMMDPKALRRNLITKGIDLGTLIGREFRIGGDVILRGRKNWPPCSHIVKQSGRVEIFKYLARDCGIGADVVVGGTISLGDRIDCALI
jgi:MOSC domain-containing protein YiiM